MTEQYRQSIGRSKLCRESPDNGHYPLGALRQEDMSKYGFDHTV